MRYVIVEERDDTYQRCTSDRCPVDGGWRGGPHDEPFSTCPICSSRLEVVKPG